MGRLFTVNLCNAAENNKTEVLECKSHDSGDRIQDLAKEKFGVSADDQVLLLWRGQTLEGEKELGDYGIQSDATIQVVFKKGAKKEEKKEEKKKEEKKKEENSNKEENKKEGENKVGDKKKEDSMCSSCSIQ